MRGGLHHEAEARVTVMLTDPSDYSKKEIIQLTTFDQITSSISLDGIGSAAVSLNNKRLSFFKGVGWPKWAQQSANDVQLFKEAASKFELEMFDTNAMLPLMYNQQDKLLLPKVNKFDRIWIDYRGRDGLWYAGFTGIITGYEDVVRAKGTPIFKIVAKDFKRLLQSYPIVYGLNNVAGFNDIATILTGFQEGDKSKKNIFAGKNPSNIIAEIITVLNRMLNITPKDEKTYWGYYSPDDDTGEISRQSAAIKMFDGFNGAGRGIAPYEYSSAEFDVWGDRKDPNAVASDFYRNPMGFAAHDTMFKGGTSIYQTVLRTQLEVFAIDQESALSIFNKVAQATFSSIYIDQAGNLRYEYPRYETLPSLSNKIDAPGVLNGTEDPETLWHGLNYWMSFADDSFLNFKENDNESDTVTTRATVLQNYALSGINFDAIIQKKEMSGYATAPENVLLRYGLREANLSTLFSNTTIDKSVLDKYAQAAMAYLNSKARSFTVTLNQRPDLMLNRNMVVLDRAQVGLITDISDTFSPVSGHNRVLTCRYRRYIGEKLEMPWRNLLHLDVGSLPGALPL